MLGRRSAWSTNLWRAQRHNERNGEKAQGNVSGDASLAARAPKIIMLFYSSFVLFFSLFVCFISFIIFLGIRFVAASKVACFLCKTLITNHIINVFLQMYVNLKQYDNSLYANVEDLTAQWPFYLLNFWSRCFYHVHSTFHHF